MNQLPPRYNQRPNSLPRFLLSLVTIFVMLGALPVAVYLVGQRTRALPQAAPAQVERPGTESFTLEKDLAFASVPTQIAVNLFVQSDEQNANLFALRVNFPSQHLELVNAATGSAQLQSPGLQAIAAKWIESKIDNQSGTYDLVAGVPSPGFKTEIDQKYILSKLIFNIKSNGAATFHLDPDSTIFASSTNSPLDVRKNDLTFNLSDVSLPPPSPTQKPKPVILRNQQTLNIIAPDGGETIGFNTHSDINWQAQNLNQVAVILLINGQKLGQIASVSASLGKFSWKPADFIMPTFLSSTNTYQIELDGFGTDSRLSTQSAGPFAIVSQDINLGASQSANLAKRGGDANKDGQVDLTDLSILFSSFGQKDNLDLGVDLNGDGVVNEVDLWLFNGVLLR